MVDRYAQWFRASTPYIRAHRGRTFVVMLGADALASGNLVNIVHDLALLHVLGVRLVLVHGAAAIADGPVELAALPAICESVAGARSKLEALFSTGIPQSPLRNRHVSLVGGNLVVAKPASVIDGVDRQAAGLVRQIHVDAIGALLDADNVVLVSPIGYSAAGAVYVLLPEQLAAAVAGELRADKLVVYHATPNVAGRSNLTTRQLDAIRDTADSATKARLDALAEACRRGVERAHLIGFNEDGMLLRELFTAEGVGTQVTDGRYRLVRRATATDIGGIVELIRPLEEAGKLVRRPRHRIENEITNFFVAELDGMLTGCCALLRLTDDAAEVACLVGGDGVGSSLLDAIEGAAREGGIRRLFALTTQASDWFAEHGFVAAEVRDLPLDRKALYNHRRNSKVVMKELRDEPLKPTAADNGKE